MEHFVLNELPYRYVLYQHCQISMACTHQRAGFMLITFIRRQLLITIQQRINRANEQYFLWFHHHLPGWALSTHHRALMEGSTYRTLHIGLYIQSSIYLYLGFCHWLGWLSTAQYAGMHESTVLFSGTNIDPSVWIVWLTWSLTLWLVAKLR